MGTTRHAEQVGTAELLDRARRGDGPALGQLLERYRNYLFLLARVQIGRRIQGKFDVADVVQETFLEVHRGIGQFRGGSEAQFLAWLRQILVGILANQVRRYFGTKCRDVRLERELQDDLDRSSVYLGSHLIAAQSSPSAQASRRELAVLLADAMEQLPEDYREVIILRQLEGLSFPQVAERMNRTEDSVKNLWARRSPGYGVRWRCWMGFEVSKDRTRAVVHGRRGGLGTPGQAPGDPSQEEVAEDDPRVIKALEEYLADCELGARPDRWRFLARHATIADRLAECIDSLDCLFQAAPLFDELSPDETGPFVSPAVGAPPSMLGDYRLLREIGRGGMGVVYEAEQVSLGRRVALKLLPFTAAMDPKQVQRFQVEVQAAAHLHHPNIVPIHGVGCESGVHYYAMQLVSGQPLSAIIGRLRAAQQGGPPPHPSGAGDGTELDLWGPSAPSSGSEPPGPRTIYHEVARLGIEAAEALEHAHSLGVVHRDIKPANLLFDQDRHLWVADFGLARLQGDSGVTATGDLVGTLRYMSPEQAMAKRGVVDHRTDIYSLGATLYELLTLRPAFQGSDWPALVHQVCNEDPTPPRRLDRRIPRDLETIVLKAMAKEPVNRYATAVELADDLRRFSAGQSIMVRRPSLAERAARWSRRHRGLVLSGGFAMVLALICLSVSTIAIWREMARTERLARARSAELNRAQANLELAHQALDLYLNSAESLFPHDKGSDLADIARLKTALTFYEQIASQNSAPEVEVRTFSAYNRVGDIRTALGDILGAEDAYRKAMRIMVRMLQRDPGDDVSRFSLAGVLEKYGNLLRKQTIYGDAEWSIVEAVRLFEQVTQRRPGDSKARLALVRALNLMASLQGETGRIRPALTETRRALELLRALDDSAVASRLDPLVVKKELASVHSNLGKWLQLDGDLSEAERMYRKALGLLEEIRAEAPGSPAAHESLALCQAMLGDLLRSTRRNDAARSLFSRAISGLERLAADYPRVPHYRKQLARFYVVLSTLHWDGNRFRESDEARGRAMAYDPQLQSGQQAHLNNLAWYLVTAANPAARNPALGLDLAIRAVELAPECWECWNTLGVARFRNGDWSGARDALLTSVAKKPGENAFDGFFLAMTSWHLGDRQAARDWMSRAEDWRLRNLPDDVELLRFRAEVEHLVEPSGRLLVKVPPAMPSSVAEALNDASFGLRRLHPAEHLDNAESRAIRARNRGENPEFSRPELRVFDVLDHALFFMDLT